MTSCVKCNGLGKVSHPNPAWTPETPREATKTTGPHGRPVTTCQDCNSTGEARTFQQRKAT